MISSANRIAFETYLRQFVSPDPAEMEAFFQQVISLQLPKKEFLLEAGQPCDYVWFLTSGILRHYFQRGTEEGTVWFSFKHDLVTDVQSFFTGGPAFHSIIAVTEVEVLGISRSALNILYNDYKIWERFGRLTTEVYVLMLVNRSYDLLFKDASAKYDAFLQRNPEALKHIPLNQIADFIGVSLETLSRIRAKRESN